MYPNFNEFQPPEKIDTLADQELDPRAFCRLRFSPMLATGVIVSILREHFGNPHSIIDPSLQKYIWRNDDASGIVIEAITNEAFKAIGQRPAIMVRRDAIQNQRILIGDKIQAVHGSMGDDFMVAFQGSHTVFNIAEKAGHAESLANESAILLLQYAPLISRHVCFRDFQLREIGKIGMYDGGGGQYVVPVTFTYHTTFEWTIDQDLPPIRHLTIKTLFNI